MVNVGGLKGHNDNNTNYKLNTLLNSFDALDSELSWIPFPLSLDYHFIDY